MRECRPRPALSIVRRLEAALRVARGVVASRPTAARRLFVVRRGRRPWPIVRRATRISTEAVPPNRPSRGKQRCAWRGARPPLAQPQARRSMRECRPRPAPSIVRRLEAALRVASGATVALRISSARRHRSVARRATIPPGRSRSSIRPPVRWRAPVRLSPVCLSPVALPEAEALPPERTRVVHC